MVYKTEILKENSLITVGTLGTQKKKIAIKLLN